MTADLKMMEKVRLDAKNFNSFHDDIPILVILAKLKDHVKACLPDKDLPIVSHLSRHAMTEYLEINFNVKLILPQDSSITSSQSDYVPDGQTTNLPGDQTVSGSNSLSPDT